MGSDESHFNVSVGSDGQSHKTVSTNHNLFEEKGEGKRYRTEVLPLTSLTHYARPHRLTFTVPLLSSIIYPPPPLPPLFTSSKMVATTADKDIRFSNFIDILNLSISKMATTLSIQILLYNYMDIQDCVPYKMGATAVDTDAVF